MTARCFTLVMLGILAALVMKCDIATAERGVTLVELSGGMTVYFKREVRGNNYDELGISLDGDPCHSLDPSADYIFEGMDHVIYYATSGSAITTFSTAPLNKPREANRRIVVTNHVVDPLAWQELSRTFATRGLKRVDVDVANVHCR